MFFQTVADIEIQQSYATAWTCLFRNLELSSGQTLLICGATSSLGQAAINLAVKAGAKVIATSRNLARSQLLLDLEVQHVVQEGPSLAERLPDKTPIDTVLELVGNSVLLESLALLRRGGRLCGFLGGLDPIVDFNPLLQMPNGCISVSLVVLCLAGFLLSDVPMQKIANEVAEGRCKAKPAMLFDLGVVMKAHEVMAKSQAGGKLVVRGVE